MKMKENSGGKKRDELVSFLDEGFPERVFQTSFLLSLIVIGCSLSYVSFMLTVSVAIGCFISLVLFRVSWWTIQRAVQRKRSQIKGFFLQISVVKYFIVGAMLLAACLFLEIHAVAMAVGLGIVMAVVVMKIVGRLLVDYLNKSIKVPFKKVKS
ncbi:MAG: ATP synthase subunit I [Candidatus Brocadiaceae bacterium]|nr:ATP synthase subunit I [Candidatus Brocadiaceae bacterium]